MTVRALVVDDSPTMRAMVSHSLSQDPDIEVVGTADGPMTAREAFATMHDEHDKYNERRQTEWYRDAITHLRGMSGAA